jgi:deazaflavin-dependent oxidoreductase (nitroreductase family)
MPWRRYSPLRGRRLRPHEAGLEKFAMSRAGLWYLMQVAPRFDKAVIPRTKGVVSATGFNKVGILTSVGAKSGQRRSQPLVMLPDGADLIVIGSNYGQAKHPSWSANLIANPSCDVTFRGPTRSYDATLLTGASRAEAWEKAVDFYGGYAVYANRCAPREIRVFRLSPLQT